MPGHLAVVHRYGCDEVSLQRSDSRLLNADPRTPLLVNQDDDDIMLDIRSKVCLSKRNGGS